MGTITLKPNSFISNMVKENKSKVDLIHKLCLVNDFLPTE